MAKVNLGAKTREKVGSQASKQVRRDGFIPATLYGHGMKPLALAVGVKDFSKALHTKAGENVVLDLQVEGVKLKESTCLIKEIQHNPITDEIAHVDFTVISLTEKIEVKVPLVVLHADEAAGIKEGGVLDVIHHEIEVECLPTQIPEKFEVDIKGMKIGDIVHAKDLKMPAGVACKLDGEEAIITVHPPAKEEIPVEEGAGAATEPEVIEKGKKVEGEEEAPAPGAKAATSAPAAKAAPAAPKPEKK